MKPAQAVLLLTQLRHIPSKDEIFNYLSLGVLTMRPVVILKFSALTSSLLLALATPALAHHGIGLYQPEINKEWSGTLTKMELINPHSYMYFDTKGPDGKLLSMRCEMRAATLIKRSGWSVEQFKVGAHVEIKGHPHRDDPHACYLESFSLDSGESIERNQQFSKAAPVDISNRPLTLASGEPNISGDWAVEQSVLTIPPSGGHGDMVPKSLVEKYRTGAITLKQIREVVEPRPKFTYSSKGKAAADAFRQWSTEDNPRLSCKPTSIVFDWTFDWPVNRVTQSTTPEGEKVVDLEYGLYGFKRRIHVGMAAHPAKLAPSSFGHSIGKWDGSVLVVDTVGIQEGVLSPPIRNSKDLHVVERFSLDTKTMALRREYTATDPVYLATPYQGADIVLLSDTPFEQPLCKEMTPEFQKP